MTARVNGIDLCYEQEGSGPDLLLIPGLGASVHVWHAQLRALSPVLRVTAVDPRGHGRSGKPAGPYSMRQMADDVAALMQHLGIERATVAGSSMASLVGVELAAAYRERVERLVLVGGFAVMGTVGKERMSERARVAEAEGMAPLAELVPNTALGAHTHQAQPALVGLFRHLLLSNDPAAYAASCRAIVEADVTPLLPQVRCPTLLVVGVQEQVAPMPAALALKAGIPHAEIAVIPNAGHLPFLEQPALFNARLLEWLSAA